MQQQNSSPCSGSYYSGADHSNQLNSTYVIGPYTKSAKFEFQIEK